MKTPGYIKLINSADTNKESIIEMNILPGEKTPWHYHTLFSETFEILKGTLEVGKGKNIHQLKQGDVATIMPVEKHYYHNVSKEECIVKAPLNPGNKNFENSLFILKGLAKDVIYLGIATGGPTHRHAVPVFSHMEIILSFEDIILPVALIRFPFALITTPQSI